MKKSVFFLTVLVALFFLLSCVASADEPASQEKVYAEAERLYFTEQDYEAAVKILEPLTQEGYAPAEWLLGHAYHNGNGVELDLNKAEKLYYAASEKGYANGTYCLAFINEKNGNNDYARETYKKAFEQLSKETEGKTDGSLSDASAWRYLGQCYYYGDGTEKNLEAAVDCLTIAIDLGNIGAIDWLGCLYANGGPKIQQDYSKAFSLFQQGADLNDSASQYHLGMCYYNGDGVSINTSKAAEYIQMAADQGKTVAQAEIGWYYLDGIGVAKDYSKALDYLLMAAEAGNYAAKANLGYMYMEGLGVAKDYSKALEYTKEAAEAGNSTAQNNYGWMFLNGYGVEKNYSEARKWFTEAEKNGNTRAKENRRNMDINNQY